MRKGIVESHSMKKIINITGACRGCGATFIAVSLVFVMGRYCDGVTYLEGRAENPGSSPFFELSLDKHIPEKRFADFSLLKDEGKRADVRVNLYGNVNWAVKGPKVRGRTEILPKDVAGRYILWDSCLWIDMLQSGGFSKKTDAAVLDAPEKNYRPDLILCVIDPLPSRVIASQRRIEAMKDLPGQNVRWIFNRGSKRDVASAEKFLNIRGDFHIPSEPQEKFYEAQRKGTSLADPAGEKNKFFPALEPGARQAFDELASYVLTLF